MNERGLENLKLKKEDLTIEEKAEIAVDALLAAEVAGERAADILKVHGKTEEELALDADALLAAAGFKDLIEQPKTQPKPETNGGNQ